MNLDQFQSFNKLDSHNMLAEIDNLPTQLADAWQRGGDFPLPDNRAVHQVILCGMGGSAIGADLFSAYIAPFCFLPVVVHRDYSLPGWAHGRETLVVACSHSGNTEETLDSFEQAVERHCTVLAMTTGGTLSSRACQAGIPLWKFDHSGQPRAAVGYSFALLLALFSRLGWIPSQADVLDHTRQAMIKQQKNLQAQVPVKNNPAKRLAGQLMGRWINVYGSGCLAPVARRWKTQLNEIAKAGAGFEVLPEADHNALAGLLNPAAELGHTMTIFLQSSADHPRNQLRSKLTRQEFMNEGLNTEVFQALAETPLASMWTTLHFGDYLAYFLAMSYEVDPTPVEALVTLKAALKASQ